VLLLSATSLMDLSSLRGRGYSGMSELQASGSHADISLVERIMKQQREERQVLPKLLSQFNPKVPFSSSRPPLLVACLVISRRGSRPAVPGASNPLPQTLPSTPAVGPSLAGLAALTGTLVDESIPWNRKPGEQGRTR
jgi:hypothetical protein